VLRPNALRALHTCTGFTFFTELSIEMLQRIKKCCVASDKVKITPETAE
jgi:hypothetical protein